MIIVSLEEGQELTKEEIEYYSNLAKQQEIDFWKNFEESLKKIWPKGKI